MPHSWQKLTTKEQDRIKDIILECFREKRDKTASLESLHCDLQNWAAIYAITGAVVCDLRDEIEERESLLLQLEDITKYGPESEDQDGYYIDQEGGLRC